MEQHSKRALFALQADDRLGERVAQHLDTPLEPHEEREFEDGEHKTRPLCNVRGRDVYVLHGLYTDARHSANDKLCRLLFFLGALRDAGAARLTAVVPYLAYARKDRRSKPFDPVTTRYVAALFEAVGVDAVLTLEVHNLAAYENAFRCRAEHLDGRALFLPYLAQAMKGRDLVIVAPDAGGVKRAEQLRAALARRLDIPIGMAFAEKHRSGGEVSGTLLVGEVRGRDAIIVDDLVSTGTTLVRTAQRCKRQGAARVLAVATHGLFAGEAARILADPALDALVVSDTVPPFRLPPGPVREKLTVLDSSPLIAEAIRRLHGAESLVALNDADTD